MRRRKVLNSITCVNWNWFFKSQSWYSNLWKEFDSMDPDIRVITLREHRRLLSSDARPEPPQSYRHRYFLCS